MESEKMDEIMLPGFRFHPTDEELVGFYLKRKVQQRPLSVELIKQLDIYKYDPWDLPKLASSTGEKEWYFYCRRDRKYRNSTRPNRVTGAGFWKATGTDRPIYSSHSQGSKCIIGLKKSLVFYRGRASKGTKTDWMMHEFRLPSLSADSVLQKRFMDKNLPPTDDSWAICRIFKKPNSAAQRAVSQSWLPPMPEPTSGQLVFTQVPHSTQLSNTSESYFSLTTKSSTSARTQFISCKNEHHHHHHHQESCIKTPPQVSISTADLSENYPFFEASSGPSKCTVEASSSSIFGDFFDKPSDQSLGLISSGLGEQYCNNYGFSMNATALPADDQGILMQAIHGEERVLLLKEKDLIAPHSNLDDQWGTRVSDDDEDSWKSNFLWDFSPCPTDLMSASYSTTDKCYT